MRHRNNTKHEQSRQRAVLHYPKEVIPHLGSGVEKLPFKYKEVSIGPPLHPQHQASSQGPRLLTRKQESSF